MKNMFTRFLLLSITTLLLTTAYAQFPTIYATVASGNWAENPVVTSPTTTIWETFTGNATGTPGAQGTGTPYTGPATPGSTNGPTGTHLVYIRAGHTVSMNGANRSCHSLTIQANGKLWANSATARRLQLVNGGTGFVYPQTGIIKNDGTIGGPTDGIYFEAGTNCQTATITGTGTTYVQRIRIPGGLSAGSGGIVNIIVDANITVTQAGNYSLSLIYNPGTTDNYSFTINAGKVITVSDTAGYVFNNSIGTGGGFGTYTYNINGTLDISPSTTVLKSSSVSPDGGTVNLNVAGTIKTGGTFNSSPVLPAVANINIATGGIIDATLAKIMNFNGNAFVLGGTAMVKRTVSNDGSKIVFPITTNAGGYNAATISGTTGPAEVFTATIRNTFTNPAPPATISREWNITEATAGGNEDTVRLAWTTADEAGSGISHAGTISIIRWNGTAWVYTPATVSGTGTIDDPYIAKAAGFTSFGFFGVSSNSALPVSFVNVKAAKKATGIQVDFGNAIEMDVLNYVIEKSANGRNFTVAATLLPKTNNGSLNSYTYTDANTVSGNNFYRIKATERNGNTIFSAVVKVNTNGAGSGVQVYPNPVKGNNLSVQLDNMDKAVYTLSLFNNLGQNVFSKQISHQGGSATMVIDLPASAAKGLYNLQINSSNFRTVKNIIIE